MQEANVNKALAKKIMKGRINLMVSNPFLSTVLMSMPAKATTQIPTAATDGRSIMYNPEFMNQYDKDEIKFIFAHEVMHVIMEHMLRAEVGGYQHRLFNQAADYAINGILHWDMGMKVVDGALLDSQYRGMSAEQIYKKLEKQQKGGGGNGGSGDIPVTGEDLMPPESSEQRQQIEAEVRAKVSQAVAAANASGQGLDTLPPQLREMIEDFLYPKKNWKEILREFITNKVPDGYDWTRPNRRYIAEDIHLPRRKSMAAIDKMLIAIDTSGSINNDDLLVFMSELNAIRQDVSIETTHVVYCDTQVYEGGEYGRYDELVCDPQGGGGTDFKPVFELADREQPDLLIYFTDLAGRFPDYVPSYPTLWAEYSSYSGFHEQDAVPFGTVIHIEEK